MAAGKHDRLVINRAKAANHAISARADIGWLLAVWAPVAEQEPAGPVGEDFAALAPLVIAVVPFEQVRIKLGGVAEPSECAGASRTLKGTGENPVKLKSLKALVEPPGLPFALFGQRNIRASRMLAACAPRGFAMADEIDTRKHGDSNLRSRGHGRRKRLYLTPFCTDRILRSAGCSQRTEDWYLRHQDRVRRRRRSRSLAWFTRREHHARASLIQGR